MVAESFGSEIDEGSTNPVAFCTVGKYELYNYAFRVSQLGQKTEILCTV